MNIDKEDRDMRNPKLIEELIDLIKQLCLKQPDLSFNQLIYSLQQQYSELLLSIF